MINRQIWWNKRNEHEEWKGEASLRLWKRGRGKKIYMQSGLSSMHYYKAGFSFIVWNGLL